MIQKDDTSAITSHIQNLVERAKQYNSEAIDKLSKSLSLLSKSREDSHLTVLIDNLKYDLENAMKSGQEIVGDDLTSRLKLVSAQKDIEKIRFYAALTPSIVFINSLLEHNFDILSEIEQLISEGQYNKGYFGIIKKSINTVRKNLKKVESFCQEYLNNDISSEHALDKITAITTTLVEMEYIFANWQSLISRENVKQQPSYIDLNRIEQIKKIQSSRFDLSKIVQLCIEINIAFENECYLAVTMLSRALIDHIPPIFGFRNFTEVANNYGGAKHTSFKKQMQHLEKSLRNIADSYLHNQIRKKESLPNRVQTNFSNDFDVLLAEIISILQ